MKENISIPGPAKAMYSVYLGAIAVWLYTGFFLFHPFASGWRYPWTMGVMRLVNAYMGFILVITAVVYLYYATLGRPKEWNEPLGIFRIVLSLLTMWIFLLTYAVYRPFGWMHPFVEGMGGPAALFQQYELFLWLMLLVSLIYAYVRWVKSERFPRLAAPKSDQEGGLIE